MKRSIVIVLFISLIAMGLVLVSTRAGGNALAQQPSEVVILRCAVSAPVSSIPIVMSSTSSAGAPGVRRGTTCAQALADLANEGFEIQAVESAGRNDDTDLYYTLVTSGP